MARVSVPDAYAHNPASFVFAHHDSEITRAALAFSKAVYQHSIVTLREFEGARARVAQINGCLVCQKFRSARDVPGYIEGVGGNPAHAITARGHAEPDEAFYDAVEAWRTSPLFSPRERLAIELADRFSQAPKSLEGDETFWTAMHENFSDAEIVDLTLAIGSWVSGGRFMHILELDSVCGMPGVSAAPPQALDQAAE
jgi:alkylhydroperoxidase family enzyme